MLEASYQDSGDGYRAAEAPKHEVSSSVFSTPGLRATAAIPFGSSLASERVNPSTAHFEVQYADTCHPHMKAYFYFTILNNSVNCCCNKSHENQESSILMIKKARTIMNCT